MKKLTAVDLETKSSDLKAENLAALRALFPELVTEGKDGVMVNLDVLKQLVGDRTVTDAEEKYGMNWHGKRRARQIALTPSTGTLRPCPAESVDWDTTQNIMIEGDNLEVLKLLQKSYSGKVKLIYIDPPYNTGKDFVYPDNFQDNIKNYLELTGQTGEGGKKLSSNTEASGRFHTDWLNMMYPRLKLARNLLREDGVIFVSIDDNEAKNLRAVCDDVFGEENFVASVIWQKVYSPKNSARHFSEDHDYVVVYAKNSEIWTPDLLARTPEMEARYSNPDNDPRGPWKAGDLSARNYYGEGTYPVTCPSGRLIERPPAGRYWVLAKIRFESLNADNRIWWGKDGNNVPAIKQFLSEVKGGLVPQTLWFYKDVGHNQESKKELIELLPFKNSDDVFETPKPTRLIRKILDLSTATGGDNLVLDFFAGSGTTGHALMAQNASDNGTRRFLCVQLPAALATVAELKDGTRLDTISEITKERLRRAGKKVREDNPMFAGDVGFRVFKLDSSNIREWDPNTNDLAEAVQTSIEHLKRERTDQDILFELLLKLGLDLCIPIETKKLGGSKKQPHDVHSIGGGTLFVCLSTSIPQADVESLALGIVKWHKQLQSAVEPTVVFRDSAFADDVAKTNLAAILQQHGLETVRSL